MKRAKFLRSFVAASLAVVAIFAFQNCGNPLMESTPLVSTDNEPTDSTEPRIYEMNVITTENRVYRDQGRMSGAWGYQLRGLMRNDSDDLFFVSDRGPNVHSNTDIDYYKKNPDGSWSLYGSQSHLAGVQQNAAHLILGDRTEKARMIMSYGMGTNASRHVEECYFDTVNPANKACNAIVIGGVAYSAPPNSNYIGGAVGENGVTRIVWWTTVGAGGGAGLWSYIYNFGGGWNGPYSLALPGYNDLSYVSGYLKNNRFIGVGQLGLGDYSNPSSYSYQASYVSMQLGQTPKLNLMVPKTSAEAVAGVRVWSANDIFVESSGAIHALAALGDHHSLDGRVGYFYLPTSDLPSTIAAHSYLPGAFRPRFTNNRDDLSLVVPRTSGKTFLDIYRRSNNTHAGQALDLSSETTSRFSVMYDSNFGYSDTVFVEHPRYQSRDAVGLEIGVLGSWERGTDNTVWNFSFK